MREPNKNPLPKKIYVDKNSPKKYMSQTWVEETQYTCYDHSSFDRELYVSINELKSVLTDEQLQQITG